MATAPLLSIGIIFKNEERCLERCLKSLEPLRQAIPCEVVMADTGATDKSREIAEQYADELFDFEWVDDFSAARNAVMDRCTGKWFLTIDSDEWLDEDISQLVAFVKGRRKANFAYVIQRNYHSFELEKGDSYNDFSAMRLMRMSTSQRYHGTIHEAWIYWEPTEYLRHTILHHDGYLFTDPKAAKAKRERNMKLLRENLEQDPDNLRTLIQCIESGAEEREFLDWIRHAVKIARHEEGEWRKFAGGAVRHAVEAAYAQDLPERDEWLALAEGQFAHSIFTMVDVNATAFLDAHNARDWEKAIQYGEGYEKGIQLLRANHQPREIKEELGSSTIHRGSSDVERTLRVGLADAYIHSGQDEKALELFAGLDGSACNPQQIQIAIVALCQLHAQTHLDTAPALQNFYAQINQKKPDEQKQAVRRAAFDIIATSVFAESYRETEREYDRYWRPGYGLFLPLAGESEIGRAAEIMLADSPEQISARLAAIEDWQSLPVEAFQHALRVGTPFPLKEKTLNVEILDGMAARLTEKGNFARKLALALPEQPEYPDAQSLYWAQSLVLAALRTFDWKHCTNAEESPAALDTNAAGKTDVWDTDAAGNAADWDTKPAGELAAVNAKAAGSLAALDARAAENLVVSDVKTAKTAAVRDADAAGDLAVLDVKAAETPTAPDVNMESAAAAPDAETADRPACTPADGLTLVRRFVQVESVLLPRMYAPQALTEENAPMLPPMHRWGMYCIRAIQALDKGSPQEYLAALRKALKACPGQKDMVQFLLDRFLEDARPKASPELLALAEKVRTILSAYSPDDPAVQAIRESPAYQQVAWLIEPEPAGQMLQ